MVKCDIRIVFHKVRFRKMSQTDPVLNANRAPGMHLLQNPGPELSVTGPDGPDRTDDGRTEKLERSLHNRPFGQLSTRYRVVSRIHSVDCAPRVEENITVGQ